MDQPEKMKPKYEKPSVVPLSQIARGQGDCLPGSTDAALCSPGGVAGECNDGTVGPPPNI